MRSPRQPELPRRYQKLIEKVFAMSEVANQPMEFARRRQVILDEFAALIGHDAYDKLTGLQAEIDYVRALAGSPARTSLSLYSTVEDRILVHENLMQLLETRQGDHTSLKP